MMRLSANPCKELCVYLGQQSQTDRQVLQSLETVFECTYVVHDLAKIVRLSGFEWQS